MGERREELRDLFESVTGTDSVTEHQRRPRGTLSSERERREALVEEIEVMRTTYDFDTARPTAELATVVEAYYDGASDADIATRVSSQSDTPASTEDIARIRLDLHLVRESERPPDEAVPGLEAIEEGEETVESVARDLERFESTVSRWRAVRKTRTKRREVADRFRQRFEDLLSDRDIAKRLTASLERTGLDEAVEDQEVDVDL